MAQPLPDYPVVRIRTGQFTPEGDQIWVAEFPVGAVEGEPSPSSEVSVLSPGARKNQSGKGEEKTLEIVKREDKTTL